MILYVRVKIRLNCVYDFLINNVFVKFEDESFYYCLDCRFFLNYLLI